MAQDEALTGQARAALAAITLPDGGTLGDTTRLAAVSAREGRVTAMIAIAPEEAEAFAPVRDAAQAALEALPGIEKALVALTAEASTPAPEASAKPPPAKPGVTPAPGASRKPAAMAGITHIVAVASGKGGVGKSTTSVNLALGLRALGLKVGILDADIYGPSLPTLLGLRGQPRVGADRKLLPMQAYGLKAMSIGLLVDEETAMVWRGPMVMSALTQMMAEVEWGKLDVLIIDMPPGTGDAQLAIAQGTELSGAVIVSTPQDLSLIDARRGITMFRKVDVPILGVVENMSHFICTDCGAHHAIFGEGGAQEEAGRLGVPFLGGVPLTMELRRASDLGQPVTAVAPDGILGRIYQGLAERLLAGLQ
ncbi:MAG: P-loop NTPase [Salinarimonas sp.]|nr:P-loop NTPase [Salinarimonas sp.]